MEKHPLDIQVEEFASPIEAFATENMTLEDMLGILKIKGFRHLPLCKVEKVIRMISIRDLNQLKN